MPRKYEKLIRELPPVRPIEWMFPENPRLGPQIVDAINHPVMTHHIEVFTWVRDGTDYYPDKGFDVTPERERLKWLLDTSPSPVYETEDGRVIFHHRPMYHTTDEIFLFLGTNPNDVMDLGGEIEFWLGIGDRAEKYIINKPSVIFVPAGTVHCPIVARNVRRPIKQIIVYTRPTIVEYGVNEWPPDYKPPIEPSKYVDLKKVKLISRV
ncbi:MAG: hypothetical protein QXK73_06390 [Candidatus Bathyarchaeia archaeon]